MKHNIYEFEVTPPPAAWEVIAARLEDDLKNAFISSKMDNYEVVPPASSWSNINARLTDDTAYSLLSSKMISYEQAPSVGSWKSIAEALNNEHKEESKTPVVWLSKKIYRYTATAIVIGVIAGAAWLLFSNTKNNLDVATNAVNHSVKPATASQNDNEIKSGSESNKRTNSELSEKTIDPDKNDAAINYQSSDITQSHLLKYSRVSSPLSQYEQTITISSKPILDEKGAVIRDMDILTTNNSYLVVTGPDGQLTRISSKFANVIRFLDSGDDVEEYLDRVIRESSIWKKRFQEWRSKISQSSFIPSSANFFDIIEFKELIDEKNNSN